MNDERAMFKALAQAIDGLTQELAAGREERKRELATKKDVKDSEVRILAAIEHSAEDEKDLIAVRQRADSLVRRVQKLARKLGRLDEAT